MLCFLAWTATRESRHRLDPGDLIAAGEALYGLVTAAVRGRPREMSLTSLSTLATLDRTGPRRVTDLAVIQGVAQPSMTVLVTALERSRLVERRGDPADRRVALVALTAAGAELLQAQRRAGAEALIQLIGKLPADEAAALAAAIPALRHLRELDSERRDPAAGDPTADRGDRGSRAAARPPPRRVPCRAAPGRPPGPRHTGNRPVTPRSRRYRAARERRPADDRRHQPDQR